MFGTAMRPSELYELRWEQVDFPAGIIQVLKGKSKAARRFIPMLPEVQATLNARHIAHGCPRNGWVFPSGSSCGHLQQGTAKGQHARALKRVNEKREENKLVPIEPFPMYCIRHTALTRLAPHCDAFALARIAGHSSITITQRYCHPQAEAIEMAFKRLSGECN